MEKNLNQFCKQICTSAFSLLEQITHIGELLSSNHHQDLQPAMAMPRQDKRPSIAPKKIGLFAEALYTQWGRPILMTAEGAFRLLLPSSPLLDKIRAIRLNPAPVRYIPCFSIFSNRRLVVFEGTGMSEEEARFYSDYWYQSWRKDQRQAGVVMKVIEKEYIFTLRENGCHCELKLRYTFRMMGTR